MAIRLTTNCIALLRIVRWQNLGIVAGCLWIFHRVLQQYEQPDAPLLLHGTHFILFVVVALCVTAFGYIINDFFDRKTDAINHPQRQSDYQRVAPLHPIHLILFFILTGGGLAVWLAAELDQWLWLPLFPLVTGSLFLYASFLKGAGWLGNLWVALLSSILHWVLILPERVWLKSLDSISRHEIILIFIGFSSLSFGISLFREIVKDMEDREGDEQAEWKTGVVRYGLSAARKAASIIGLLTGSGLLMSIYFIPGSWLSRFALLSAMILLIGLVWRLQTARVKQEFHHISQGAKWVLMIGLVAILSL